MGWGERSGERSFLGHSKSLHVIHSFTHKNVYCTLKSRHPIKSMSYRDACKVFYDVALTSPFPVSQHCPPVLTPPLLYLPCWTFYALGHLLLGIFVPFIPSVLKVLLPGPCSANSLHSGLAVLRDSPCPHHTFTVAAPSSL